MSQRSTLILLSSHESLAAAVEEWSTSEDWVRWIFSGIRARMETLTAGREVLQTELAVRRAWQEFTQRIAAPDAATAIHRLWHSVQAGDADAWREAEGAWHDSFTGDPTVAGRSIAAGELLLSATRGARHQGLLGRIRTRVEEGSANGHILPVWLAVGSFFQLGLAPIIAEYLRLEWEMLSRRVPGGVLEPLGSIGLTGLTSRILQGAPANSVRLASAV